MAGYQQVSLCIVHISFALCLAVLLSEAQAERGLASYYSYKNRGHPGELTCAQRTRPFGSMVSVSYGGQSIVCRVADRGPFIRGRDGVRFYAISRG